MANKIREAIVSYLQARQMSDGGFMFARVTPSGGKDTYLATMTLAMLKAKFAYRSVLEFWNAQFEENASFNCDELFWAIDSVRLLRTHASLRWKQEWEKEAKLYLTSNNVDSIKFHYRKSFDTPSFNQAMLAITSTNGNLEDLYYWVSLHRLLKMPFDEWNIADRVMEFQRDDGGFGERGSDAMGTLFAIKIFNVLHRSCPNKENVRSYLESQFMKFNYMESLYAVVEGLVSLGSRLPRKKDAVAFVLSCQMINGGFARSDYGAPTIENTYQAARILRDYKTI